MKWFKQRQSRGAFGSRGWEFFQKRVSRLGKVFFGLMLLTLLSEFMLETAAAGFKVRENLLLDKNGVPFIMRGVNYPHVWFTSKTTQAISDIASVGANAVRVVLGNGKQWGPTPANEVEAIIEQLKEHKMIAVLEIHDCTGYGEKSEAAQISSAVDYWVSIKDTLIGQEDYVIINIANEPLGNNVATSTWANIHMEAITRLRNAGLTHTLMVDAANWGQDWEKIMLNDAPQVFSSDPKRNIIFSIHMYQVYGSYDTINDYMATFVNDLKLPLVVGEFGADHQGEDVDEDSILELAEKYQIGYLGWSWSGNSGETESLDIAVDFNVNELSSWGDFLINSTYGIRQTSQIASVFNEGAVAKYTGNQTDTDIDGASTIPGCGDSYTAGCSP